MRAILLFVLILPGLLPFSAPADEPPKASPAPGAEAPPAAPKPTESSPEALALLDKAIAHQGPRELAEPGAIRDITVRISARVYDYNKQPPQMVSLGVNRFMAFTPEERFRSEWKTSADTQIQGFDGQRFWYVDSETNKFLLGDESEQDRREIRDEMDETRHLLKLFFLANLKAKDAIFTLAPDETVEAFEQKIACHVVERATLVPSASDPPLKLWFDVETASLRKATAMATGPGQKSITFLFRYDEEVQPRVKGVLVPYKIEIWDQPFGAPIGRIAVAATLEAEGGVEFNTDLDPAIFRRPPPK